MSVIAIISALAISAATQMPVRHEPVRPSHQAQISEQPCTLANSLRTKNPYVVSTEFQNWSATVVETDPAIVPYDQARACIRLQGPNRVVRHIAIGDFRTLRLQWVNERLLYVFTDVGHIAGVGQLFDVVEGKRIYAQTEIYVTSEPPAFDER